MRGKIANRGGPATPVKKVYLEQFGKLKAFAPGGLIGLIARRSFRHCFAEFDSSSGEIGKIFEGASEIT
jgi:hypothetical protein